MVSTEIAAVLAEMKPDRGNRYSTRTVKTKGAGAYEQWRQTCITFCHRIAIQTPGFDRAEFLRQCGMGD